jgi:hypothetical protein
MDDGFVPIDTDQGLSPRGRVRAWNRSRFHDGCAIRSRCFGGED